jgi:hypothetical protein
MLFYIYTILYLCNLKFTMYWLHIINITFSSGLDSDDSLRFFHCVARSTVGAVFGTDNRFILRHFSFQLRTCMEWRGYVCTNNSSFFFIFKIAYRCTGTGVGYGCRSHSPPIGVTGYVPAILSLALPLRSKAKQAPDRMDFRQKKTVFWTFSNFRAKISTRKVYGRYQARSQNSKDGGQIGSSGGQSDKGGPFSLFSDLKMTGGLRPRPP